MPQTGKVAFGNRSQRQEWMREGLSLDLVNKSFWQPYVGKDKNSIIHRIVEKSFNKTHIINFDARGSLEGPPVIDRDTATGTGEKKKLFNDYLHMRRYRKVAENGDEWDGVDIGDLMINQHMDSRQLLADWNTRFIDQCFFDLAQGHLGFKSLDESKALISQDGTHKITVDTTKVDPDSFDYNKLLDISTILKTSRGFDTGGIRRPMRPTMYNRGKGVDMVNEACYVMLVNSEVAKLLRQDSRYQDLVVEGSMRGMNNKIFTGAFGKIQNLILVEAPTCFGGIEGNDSANPNLDFNNLVINTPGLRSKDTSGRLQGQESYDATTNQTVVCPILGANAFKHGIGKMPDYRLQDGDFGINSESCLTSWQNMKKTKYETANSEDYVEAKVADIDNGIIEVEITYAV